MSHVFLFSATKPDKNTNRVEVQKKKKDSAFKKAPDGRLIIKDNSDSEDDSRHRKISLIPGLSDSGRPLLNIKIHIFKIVNLLSFMDFPSLPHNRGAVYVREWVEVNSLSLSYHLPVT